MEVGAYVAESWRGKNRKKTDTNKIPTKEDYRIAEAVRAVYHKTR